MRLSRHFGNRDDGLVRRFMARDGPYANLVTAMRDIIVEAAQPEPPSGCSAEFIESLPEKDQSKEINCCICLEKCKEGQASCQLPCSHAFDRSCIESWLKENDICPVCRTKLDQ